MNYSEPLLTISDVMNLLDNRGISYDDKQKAEDTLRNMSLFRLKGYLYPFEQDHATHLLKSGTTFEKVLKLHDFDVALRALISQWLQTPHIPISSLNRLWLDAKACLKKNYTTMEPHGAYYDHHRSQTNCLSKLRGSEASK